MNRFTVKTGAILLLSTILLSSGIVASAADYQYDGLDRVTSVQRGDQTTTYTYDPGGNLLSVTSTNTPTVQKSNIVQGWTAYMTKGMKSRYETATANVYGSNQDAPVRYFTSSVAQDVYGSAPVTVTQEVYSEPAPLLTAQWLTLDAKQTGGANIYRDIPVQRGTLYTYEGWVKTEEMKDAVVQVIVNYYDKNNRLLRYDNLLNLKQNTDWKSYNASLVAPTGAVKARVHLQIVLLKANGHAKAGFADRTFEKAGGAQ